MASLKVNRAHMPKGAKTARLNHMSGKVPGEGRSGRLRSQAFIHGSQFVVHDKTAAPSETKPKNKLG